MNYEKMTKPQLIKAFEELQAKRSAVSNSSVSQSEQSMYELQSLLHELQVHQIQLEMQNRELRETHQALEESRNRYADLYDFAPVGYASLNDQGLIQEINLTGAAMLGVERTRLTGKPFTSFVVKSDTGKFLHHIQRCKQGEGKMVTELSLEVKGRGLLDVQLLSVAVQDVEQNARLHRTAITDMTERKWAEEALRQSEERYRELFENANDIIYTMDLAGNITSLNRMGERITGYSRAEVLKMNLSQIVTPEHRDLARQMIEGRTGGEGAAAYQLEIVSKDRHRVMLEVSTRLVYQRGNPVGVQGIARDITERKKLEDELRQLQKMDAVGKLAGGVAHDFNNIMTAVVGYADLTLLRLSKDDPLRSKVQEIKKAGERAAALTQQLLAFSRKQILQPKVLDLNTLISDSTKMLRPLIGEDIELVAVLDPALGRVKADPGQIEQVIMNLALNARDAMPRGGRLTIETANVVLDEECAHQHVSVQPGPCVMLAVSDTGSGMDIEAQSHIFEPFFTTKQKGKGTGLGLSTVYGIVKQSGGNIWVYSELGKGTAFKIYLPRIEEAAEKVATRPSLGEIASGSETILLVEDEEMVRKLIGETLQMQGYQVLEAAGAGEALLISEKYEGPIHLMVTDVVMPLMSGRELAIKLGPIRPATKVIYMSGYTEDTVVHHGVLEPGVDFIQKPFSPDALARKVREVLENTRAFSANINS